jgi:hypothetical protein
MEPTWMKPVTSRTVCDFFYILFWARVIAAVVVVLLMVFTIFNMMKGSLELYAALLTQGLVLSIVVVDAMFTYLICERALITAEK